MIILVVVGLACGVSSTQSQTPPSLTPSPTAISSIRIPDDGRLLFDAWQVILQDFVETDRIDTRVLSDGAILGILDVTGEEELSLVDARDLAFRLENAGGLFDGRGGEELRDAYEVWAYAFEQFVEDGDITIAQLNVAAIEGVIDALSDPYTAFLDPDDLRLDQEDLQGSFEGIGAFVDTNDEGYVLVVAPIEGAPAAAAGIRAGDVVLEVNGEPTNEMSLREAILRIRGPRGTSVTLLVQHLLDGEPVEIVVTRADIAVDSVSLNSETDEIVRIQINRFSQRTPSELREALTQAVALEAQGLIIDLRFNPGGLLAETVQVADEFLDGGLVLYEQDSEGRRLDWNADSRGLATEIPLVILVNEFSASGAEVLAGALQDHDRATLIGSQTFGKGSVTHLRSLRDGSGIYVTFARWYTPTGRLIEGDGITPDIVVPIIEADLYVNTDEEGYVTVVAAIEGTLADAADIRAGDVILEVNGEPTNQISLQEAILRIRSPRGTSVTLLVKHLGDEEPAEIEITRGDISVEEAERDPQLEEATRYLERLIAVGT